jgi:hypothetical protein
VFEQVFRQVPVRVDHSDALAGGDILKDHVSQQCRRTDAVCLGFLIAIDVAHLDAITAKSQSRRFVHLVDVNDFLHQTALVPAVTVRWVEDANAIPVRQGEGKHAARPSTAAVAQKVGATIFVKGLKQLTACINDHKSDLRGECPRVE